MADLKNLDKYLQGLSLNDSYDVQQPPPPPVCNLSEFEDSDFALTPVKKEVKTTVRKPLKTTEPKPLASKNIPEAAAFTPSPKIDPNVIVLDPDTDSNDDDGDDANYEMSVKVRWNTEVIERHTLKKFQPFGDLMTILAKRESANASNVVLMKDDIVIQPMDTPDGIKLRVTDILTGRIIEGSPIKQKKGKKNKNLIKIKLQAAGLKRPVEIEIDKTEAFSAIVGKVAKVLNVNPKDIKLKFDGDIIDMTETPNDLDLEGDEVLDCVV